MRIEIINTGCELMLGFVLNTHHQWLCRQFSSLGYRVQRQIAVPDSALSIKSAVRDALSRADLVITTGGLGPTSDDLTRDQISALLQMPLIENTAALENIRTFFASREKPMPERTKLQALVPEGALVLPNQHGTAPGLALEIPPGQFQPGPKNSWLIMLPGPPRELKPMFLDQVVPLLRHKLGFTGDFHCRTLKTTGLGESRIEELIADPLAPLTQAGLELGYCARVGEVEVRLTAPRTAEGEALIHHGLRELQSLLAGHIFGMDNDLLEDVVVRLLAGKRLTVALAESCTGGFVANRLTNVPGASAVLHSSCVTYSNDAKQKLLGVRPETLARHGAVSRETASEMAQGARAASGADFGLSITGIAGPGGGSPGKPVGTVFMALADRHEIVTIDRLNPYERETFKFVTSQQALELLRQRALIA